MEELLENYHFFEQAGLLGYYPELITNRMVQYPGTDFNLISLSKNYFASDNVRQIYSALMEFKPTYEKAVQGCRQQYLVRELNYSTIVSSLPIFYDIRLSIYHLFFKLITRNNIDSELCKWVVKNNKSKLATSMHNFTSLCCK